jgi:O-antigen/teichoic acid export membrane protein
LLGTKYTFTGELLTILSPIMFLKSISFACAVVLVVVGWQHRRIVTQFISAVFNVLANIIILPIFGIVGVSWMYVVSEFMIVIGYAWTTNQWRKKSLP